MKKAILYAVILLIGYDIIAQTVQFGISDSTTLNGPGEKIRLFTDRSMYCVNETIFFTADYSCKSEEDSILWSRVLYVELIKWNGVKLANLKLKLDISGANGSLRVPGDILSGNYYLRAYTKWMRNFSVYDYAYQPIKIVNPFQAGIDAGPETINESKESSLRLEPSNEFMEGIHSSMNKSTYQPREKAEVEFYINGNNSIAAHDYCVSIAKVGSIDTSFMYLKSELETSGIKWDDIEYLPEIWGITISGKVIDKNANAPKKNLLVNLSQPAQGAFFSVFETDEKGRFIFSLPNLYGKYDFFIQSEVLDTGVFEFLIDNGFCNRPVILPYIAFRLSENERHLVREMMVNLQLNEKFSLRPDTTLKLQINRDQPIPFYGIRPHHFTKKYIELPNVEEFFIEIVPEAEVVYNNGIGKLNIEGISGFSNYPPLVFLDNIQVKNDDRLLKVPLHKIERVEAIEGGYLVGNMKYSGLVSIYSKNKDYAGLTLNKNSMFFAYDLFSEENSASVNDAKVSDSRIPDRRNHLYWNPHISLSKGQKTTISFYTSDNKGDYVVYILGKHNKDGRQIYGKYFFSVK